ncbi:MAG: tetratricopeptide repeat protein [Pseudomonadota bacterium]
MDEKINYIQTVVAHLSAASDAVLIASTDDPKDPNLVSLAANLARSLLQLKGGLTPENLAKVETLLQLVLAASPQDREALLARITVADALKHPQIALQHARELAQTLPEDETVLRRLAKMAWKAGAPEQAAEAMISCRSTRAADAGILLNISRDLIAKGHHRQAEPALRRILEQRPDHQVARALLEDSLRQARNPDEADKEADGVADLETVATLAAKGQGESALEMMAVACQSSDVAYKQVRKSCEAIADLGNTALTETAWRLAVGRFPEERLSWMRLCDAALAHHDIEAALQVLSDAQQFFQSDAVLKLKEARLLIRARRLPEAHDVLAALLEQDPADGLLRETYGKVLLDMGHADAADAVFQDVLNRDPGNHAALLGRVDVATDRGDVARAFELLEERLSDGD